MTSLPTRPIIMGTHGVVTSGHYLATAAGLRIMAQGGNAIDAAAAMGLCLTLLEPQNNGLGGEVPTLIYAAKERKVFSVCGLGWSPQAFTIDWCRKNNIDLIPGDGYLPACVPAMVDTWALALVRFGTMSFAQVAQPCIQLAEEGFPVYDELHEVLVSGTEKYTHLYPSTGKVYLPGGKAPAVGELLRSPDWAAVLRSMCQAEAAEGKSRIAGIEAARDVFYRGWIAEKIVEFIHTHPVEDASGKAHTGLMSYEDLSEWHATLEEPVAFNYRGLEVYKCSSWTQGPVFLQQLALLEGWDLLSLGHNSEKYLHAYIECAKLAFADREAYYGDPSFDDVPFEVLLSREYNDARRKLVADYASPDLRPGDAGRGFPVYATHPILEDNRRSLYKGDTTHLDAVDAQGNMVASTPSGGWIPASPVIEGLGFPLGTRGQMFYLNPERPNALAPHKRPRATLTPTLVLKDGRPFMGFGTQGGDCQDQWTLQFFLNHIDFHLDLQAAIDAPTVHSDHFPSSFYPRQAYPLQVTAEDRIDPEVMRALERRGHRINVIGGWENGRVMCVEIDPETGLLYGAASPRGNVAYAMGF